VVFVFGLTVDDVILAGVLLKENLENYRFTLERYPCSNKNYWWFQFFLVCLGCREI